MRPLDLAIPFLWGVVTPFAQPLTPSIESLIAALGETAAAILPGFRRRDPADRDAIAAAVYGAELADPRRATAEAGA